MGNALFSLVINSLCRLTDFRTQKQIPPNKDTNVKRVIVFISHTSTYQSGTLHPKPTPPEHEFE